MLTDFDLTGQIFRYNINNLTKFQTPAKSSSSVIRVKEEEEEEEK